MKVVITDGGRAEAGFKGSTNDCVTRALALVTGLPYLTVYNALNDLAGKSVSRTGVPKDVSKTYLKNLGFVFTPTMGIGTGCKVHLKEGELPMGRLVVSCSRHLVAVIDGVIYDSHDPSRGGTRCVYGYWKKP
jgi:hypothetical protein